MVASNDECFGIKGTVSCLSKVKISSFLLGTLHLKAGRVCMACSDIDGFGQSKDILITKSYKSLLSNNTRISTLFWPAFYSCYRLDH